MDENGAKNFISDIDIPHKSNLVLIQLFGKDFVGARPPGDARVLPPLRLQPGPGLWLLQQYQHQVLPPQQIRPCRAALLLLPGLRPASVHLL